MYGSGYGYVYVYVYVDVFVCVYVYVYAHVHVHVVYIHTMEGHVEEPWSSEYGLLHRSPRKRGAVEWRKVRKIRQK